jgi:hypothetical protein
MPPTPAEYAQLDFEARGAVIAAMSAAEARQYAIRYTAYLSELGGVPVNAADVLAQMFVCAVGWRGAHQMEAA